MPTPVSHLPTVATAITQRSGPTKAELDAIIAKAAAAAKVAEEEVAAAAAAAALASQSKDTSKSNGEHRRKHAKGKPKAKSGSHQLDMDKRLLKLVGDVVVKYMSRYRDEMDHEVFKKHAKEVCCCTFF